MSKELTIACELQNYQPSEIQFSFYSDILEITIDMDCVAGLTANEVKLLKIYLDQLPL